MYSVRKEGVVGIELTCSVAPGDMEYPEDSILIFLSWQAVNWHTWSDTVDDKIIQVDRPSLLQRGRCSLCSSGVCFFVCIYFLSVRDQIFSKLGGHLSDGGGKTEKDLPIGSGRSDFGSHWLTWVGIENRASSQHLNHKDHRLESLDLQKWFTRFLNRQIVSCVQFLTIGQKDFSKSTLKKLVYRP